MEEMIAVGHRAWENPEYAPYREACEDLYRDTQRRMVEDINAKAKQDELRLRMREHHAPGSEAEPESREDEREVSRDLPPPPSREGASGGFTSING